jgi:hypothetical protein
MAPSPSVFTLMGFLLALFRSGRGFAPEEDPHLRHSLLRNTAPHRFTECGPKTRLHTGLPGVDQ